MSGPDWAFTALCALAGLLLLGWPNLPGLISRIPTLNSRKDGRP